MLYTSGCLSLALRPFPEFSHLETFIYIYRKFLERKTLIANNWFSLIYLLSKHWSRSHKLNIEIISGVSDPDKTTLAAMKYTKKHVHCSWFDFTRYWMFLSRTTTLDHYHSVHWSRDQGRQREIEYILGIGGFSTFWIHSKNHQHHYQTSSSYRNYIVLRKFLSPWDPATLSDCCCHVYTVKY